MKSISKDELTQFENEVAELFNSGAIRAPVHLYSGNEQEMIDIFRHIRSQDWVFCTWRSHYQCLLKGVDKHDLISEIKNGKSISLNFPKLRIYSSAIVGGCIPWAVGVSLVIARKKLDEHVYCFMGDMTSETGIAQTSIQYARNHELPITFIVEDNNHSVLSDTRKVWNTSSLRYESMLCSQVMGYKYESKWPHAGAGKRVQF